MKNMFKFLVPMAAAAIALVSCQPKEEQFGNNPAGEVTIRVHAQADNLKAADQETKTYIDNTNTIIWGTGEYMKLALTAGENTTFANSTDASADAFNGEPEAMFEFSVTPESASEYVYQGLYPASAASTTNNENAANYKVNLPAIQNATASSYDPAAYIMVAKPETFTSVQTDWLASYRRGTALNKVTLKNVPSGVSFNKVKITAEGKKLAGGRHFNLTTGEGTDVYGTDATIEVLYATPLSGTSVDVWFTSWDAEIAAGEKLTIVAYTTDSKSYTKEITVPEGKTIKFQEGYLNTLGANLSGITPKTVETLEAGNYVVLAKDGSNYYALKAEKEEGKERLLSVVYTGNTTSYSGSSDLIWSITSSGDSFIFENSGKYLGYKGSSNESYWLEAGENWTTDNYLLDVSAQETAGQYYVTLHSNASRYLSKNSSSAFFAFYGNTQQKADIVFVPATALETVATPTFNPAAGEVASGTEVTISTATDGATIYYTTDGSTPTTSSNQGTSVIITSATTIKAIAVKEGMANSEVATAQYTITGIVDYPTLETSNVTLTAGTNGSTATVNGEEAIKVGTSSKGGDMSVTVPAGTTKLHIHAAAWNGVTGLSLNISGATVSPTSIALSADSGISNSSPFTLNGNPEDFYFVLELSNITADTEITFTSSIAKRFVVWGVNAEAGASVTWNLESIAITTEPTKTTYTEGQSFDPAGMVVTGHFVDADDNTNTKDEEVTGYTITPNGALATTDTQVTITYQGKTATQSITVNVANDGSLERPFTASEARSLALSGDTGSYYISGIVTKIQNQYSASYGTANFWIDEDGEDQTVFEGYKIKYFGDLDWVEGNAQIEVQDEVIIYGTLTVYTGNNNNTPETSSGYLVSLNGITKGLTLAAPTVTTNDSAKQITVAWAAATGTNSAVSYVVNCGTQSYNATAAGSHTFTMADYGTYNVSVEATAADAVPAKVNTSATLTDPNAGTPTVYTIEWGTGYNSTTVSSYTATWDATKDGFKVNMANFNNNNNNWNYVKCGRKNANSVATIITDAAIAEAIKTVTITIDALTVDNINSITLYVSSSKTSGWTAAGTFAKATGSQSVTIASPAANKFYKLEFDCASGSSNGLLTLSKVVYSTN